MFYSGGLQAGIALAVTEAKAVICFVRDDEEASTVWEEEYFDDEQFAQLLETRSVLLRLTKGSDEAGFLTSFCPIARFPAVVVIKNGMLREYIVPEISKDDFRRRLRAALDENQLPSQNAPSPTLPNLSAAPSSVAETTPSPTPTPTAMTTTTPISSPSVSNQNQPEPPEKRQPEDRQPDQVGGSPHNEGKNTKAASSPPPQPAQKPPQSRREEQIRRYVASIQEQIPGAATKTEEKTTSPSDNTSTSSSKQASTLRQPVTPTPPKQYRLQVRLFDGSSVRRSFSPSQTIRGDIRPWLDDLIQDEKRPYNLKHILTPLPNRTLTIAEEERTLEDLGLGSTANLVMTPINTYTEAYSTSGPILPVRAAYSAYGLLSSVVGTATGLVSSFLGYNSAPSAPSETAPAPSSSSDGPRRPRLAASSGPRIRTLRDQREENDSQFYNGNQLNFEPRRDTDGQ